MLGIGRRGESMLDSQLQKKGKTGAHAYVIMLLAIILIGTIAAMTFLMTASRLQNKAMLTTTEVMTEVTAGPRILYIAGVDGSTGYLENISMVIRAPAGYPDPVNLRKMLVRLSLDNSTQNLIYSADGPSTTWYDFNYLFNSTDHLEGYMVTGDVLEIIFIAARPMVPGEEVYIVIRPDVGELTAASFHMPESLGMETELLYP